MVALPILGRLAYNFLTKSNAEIQQDFPISAYLFLCSIFVAMTNQVKGRFFYLFLDLLIRLMHTRKLIYLFSRVADTQMVTHLLGTAKVGVVFAKLPHHFAATSSSYPSCGTARNIFLHYNRLAELAVGKNSVIRFLYKQRKNYNIKIYFHFSLGFGVRWRQWLSTFQGTSQGRMILSGHKNDSSNRKIENINKKMFNWFS